MMKALITTGHMALPNGRLSRGIYDMASPSFDLRPGGVAFVRYFSDFDDMAQQEVEGRDRSLMQWGLDLSASDD